MLVLSRKKNESIVINHDITVVVVEIRGDKVRLGVEAPKEVPVHRKEVYDAIHGLNDQKGKKAEKEQQQQKPPLGLYREEPDTPPAPAAEGSVEEG